MTFPLSHTLPAFHTFHTDYDEILGNGEFSLFSFPENFRPVFSQRSRELLCEKWPIFAAIFPIIDLYFHSSALAKFSLARRANRENGDKEVRDFSTPHRCGISSKFS